MSRRLHAVLDGGGYFERLLTRFSVPEELFGPLSMRALERDLYLRNTEGYLPQVRTVLVQGAHPARRCPRQS
jgi:MoxR-like ATPase